MQKRFSFYAIVKDFNNGKVEQYDVMPVIYRKMYKDNGELSEDFYVYDTNFNRIPINSKEILHNFVKRELMYHFWARCEYEFIAIDWPYRNTIEDSRPIKIDVFDQVSPNIPIIVDLLWEEIKDKI